MVLRCTTKMNDKRASIHHLASILGIGMERITNQKSPEHYPGLGQQVQLMM